MKKSKLIAGILLGVMTIGGAVYASTTVSDATVQSYQSYQDGSNFYQGTGTVKMNGHVVSGADAEARTYEIHTAWPDSDLQSVVFYAGQDLNDVAVQLPDSGNSYYVEAHQHSGNASAHVWDVQ